jgi:hypothetical protein
MFHAHYAMRAFCMRLYRFVEQIILPLADAPIT